MKKIIFASLFTLAAALGGCQEWLDVQPKTTVKQDRLFEDESGFRDALIGCYMLMCEPQLYGRDLTITFLEVLAQQYDMLPENSYSSTMRYEYEYMASRFSTIWGDMYRIIANLNSILNNIDDKRGVMTPTAYAVIKGEALALRAYIHFDLLRMFGPGNLAATPANLNRPAIPYVTVFDKHLTPQHTVGEVLGFIHADIAAAEELLDRYDSFGTNRADDMVWPDGDLFYGSRRSRLNFRALHVLAGRVYMWEGNYGAALEYLNGYLGQSGSIAWINSDRQIFGTAGERDYKGTTEAYFMINPNQHYEMVRQYVDTYQERVGDFAITNNSDYFFLTDARRFELYDPQGSGSGDWRVSLYELTPLEVYTFLKYTDRTEWSPGVRNHVVLIRKPEVYYMAAECCNELGDHARAAELLNQVRISRGIPYNMGFDGNAMTKAQIDAEIEKEYQKECFCEGVMFYYYKRLNKIIPRSQQASGDKLFVFPIPQTEIEIGGRVQPYTEPDKTE